MNRKDGHTVQAEELEALLSFEPEEEPEEFFGKNSRQPVSDTVVKALNSFQEFSDVKSADWNLDLSPASIAGEGFSSSATVASDDDAESDFIQVHTRRRKSLKHVVFQTGTNLSIDPDLCSVWAVEILAKAHCSLADIDRIVADCKGNGDIEDLRSNLQRTLEAAGYDVDHAPEHCAAMWGGAWDASSEELAEAIEVALTRRTRLPGTKRSVMDKAGERSIMDAMMLAKQELLLEILASETAIETIVNIMNQVREGSRELGTVSLRTTFSSRPDNGEADEVMAAADALRSWHATGRVMDGKRRRDALAALDALDLSRSLHKELVRTLEQFSARQAEARQLNNRLLVFESAIERLIRENLPYVRQFASQNVQEGEDAEDVFQVAFIGLQQAAWRFDPERGHPFGFYAYYWMRQTVSRWRSDEGSAIRIPVHRAEDIAKFDRALEKLDVQISGLISDIDLAEELEWTVDKVKQFRSIPRRAEYPEHLEDWDKLLPASESEDLDVLFGLERIVAKALSEMTAREANVLRMRFGIGEKKDMTLEEIGQFLGVTGERIRQIESKALKRLSRIRQLRQGWQLLREGFPRISTTCK